MLTLEPATGVPVGQPVRITRSAGRDVNPAVSPDGNKIVFESNRGDGHEIYVMRASPEGSDNRPRPLTDGRFKKRRPEWSPDGAQIAFESYDQTRDAYDGHQTDIWKMRADGSNKICLTASRMTDYTPVWSPNGRYIAFASVRGSHTADVWKMRPVPEGPDNQPVNLTDQRGSTEAYPSWQPLP